jgi:hypothetical protein
MGALWRFMIIIKDGRVYIANIKTDTIVKHHLYQAFFTTRKDEWTNIVVRFPLSLNPARLLACSGTNLGAASTTWRARVWRSASVQPVHSHFPRPSGGRIPAH